MKLLQLRWLNDISDAFDQSENWKTVRVVPPEITNDEKYIEGVADGYIDACIEHDWTKTPQFQLRIINVQ